MSSREIRIRSARETDLDSVNRVIKSAVMSWVLPERVKRLSLPVCRYNRLDLMHMDMVVAEDQRRRILGVAAWEEADPGQAPAGCRALLLHGIYVDQQHHRQGIGRWLFGAAEAAVRQQGYDGIVVKAQQDATAFFESLGMSSLPVDDTSSQYINRLWKDSA